MPAESSAPTAFKHWLDAAKHRALADALAALAPGFDRARFLELTLTGLDARSLMERVRRIAAAWGATLPGDFAAQLAVLRALAPRLGRGFAGVMFPEFVAQFGLAHPALALDALRFFTPFGSSEFGIRPFLARDPAGTLATMREWTRDPDEHVRRLASEGCRPRLPWGLRLQAFVADPAPLGPILDALRADPALYVRKSVANNLNDIAKDHPDWVLDRLAAWGLDDARTAWIARHACRTLIKRGHPRALKFFGVGAAPKLAAELVARPAALALGGTLALSAKLRSTAKRPQKLAVDYVVHYARPGGKTAAKVFKWTELTLAAGATAGLTKRQTIRDFTTRRHHAGRHRVELQVNGVRLAATAFTLRVPARARQ